MKIFSFGRLNAVMVKEFIQMRRDKVTFAMIIGIPLLQLFLFGFAINTNPRNLPTAIVNPDYSDLGRRILVGMENSTYFRFVTSASTEAEARDLLKRGEVQFVVNFPINFSHDVIKGLKPSLLLEADATDPAATSRALNVFAELASTVLNEELVGPLEKLSPGSPPYQPVVHAIYNPLAITSYNIVPGLLGVVLTMTMVIITALVLTREFERGTMENLLATPLKPLEVMIGKIIPYIIVGYAQVAMILAMAKFVFGIPMEGNIFLLLLLCLPFIAANLSVGLTFSTLAYNQLQAVQGAMFFFLPSILLSGFMFPFRGMPEWAQLVGNVLPLTHFLIIVRGILLKGNGFLDVWREVIPILAFTFVVMIVGFSRYRKTLD
ncbi:ABC transporter permease [Legionella jamestowniensis]|uniref:ABC transporter permease n=1 Tax=Legionella jamestowniensis TaxID=455 RepID=A0A0W0UKA5_9GAMM|nr:ABC transporter permease [Legionella jamestowniensis]KTD08292.1 ABC transporter permease [Legionella jamestowniensis]OCH97182.1 mannose-1-phosphate guanyltransferase [Legionella jamestowniensis]SFL49350.1 ABC-2 type transport system permease protein [Legionella jamestowniensis DSM 19215]